MPDRSVGTCPDCGKQRFSSRAEAKRIARQYRSTRLSAYRCGDYWHLGELPPEIRRGTSSRDAVRDYPTRVTRRNRGS